MVTSVDWKIRSGKHSVIKETFEILIDTEGEHNCLNMNLVATTAIILLSMIAVIATFYYIAKYLNMDARYREVGCWFSFPFVEFHWFFLKPSSHWTRKQICRQISNLILWCVPIFGQCSGACVNRASVLPSVSIGWIYISVFPLQQRRRVTQALDVEACRRNDGYVQWIFATFPLQIRKKWHFHLFFRFYCRIQGVASLEKLFDVCVRHLCPNPPQIPSL